MLKRDHTYSNLVGKNFGICYYNPGTSPSLEIQYVWQNRKMLQQFSLLVCRWCPNQIHQYLQYFKKGRKLNLADIVCLVKKWFQIQFKFMKNSSDIWSSMAFIQYCFLLNWGARFSSNKNYNFSLKLTILIITD